MITHSKHPPAFLDCSFVLGIAAENTAGDDAGNGLEWFVVLKVLKHTTSRFIHFGEFLTCLGPGHSHRPKAAAGRAWARPSAPLWGLAWAWVPGPPMEE